ncbi:hypothetical protein VNO80_27692 [Phaseolus coccineus]|uniref:Terpene synthase N-terminal domain-containing protein n=1 Tax=Phaseolus coccineus TaxID=3886 RepID=A0AAN9QFF4_PHACN
MSLPNCLATTQSPSGSSSQLVGDANKLYTPFNTPPNFQPSPFTHKFIRSLGNKFAVETLQESARKLEEKVRVLMNGTNMEPLNLLELIDDIERLGLSFKFEKEINKALLKIVSMENFEDRTRKSLHETALLFGILRRHGFDVSQDIFMSFKDEEGKFKAEISNNVKGMLSLYEASYLSLEGESVWEANAFSRTHLMNLMKEGLMDVKMTKKVRHVLEGLPYHRSCFRLMARQYINRYDKMEPHNLLLLELAKLDFNMEQSSHQNELKELSRSHKELTKVGQLITIIDDIYDIYGTLDELELFTDAIESKDITDQVLHSLTNHHDMLSSAFTIFRLTNDLATSTDEIERGETSNSIVSYMHETSLPEEKVREYFKTLIDKEWKTLNKYLVMDSIFPKSFVEVVINLVRSGHYIYQYGDGYGRQNNTLKSQIESLLEYPF